MIILFAKHNAQKLLHVISVVNRRAACSRQCYASFRPSVKTKVLSPSRPMRGYSILELHKIINKSFQIKNYFDRTCFQCIIQFSGWF